jgi:glycosyltransferase involved in cell wall biosynthesis
MKTLLYLSNRSSSRARITFPAESLSALLQEDGYQMHFASSRKNIFFRVLNMIYLIIRYRNEVDFVLIETHSMFDFYHAYYASRLCVKLRLKYIPILSSNNLPKRLRQSPRMSEKLFGDAFLNIAPSKYLLKVFADEGHRVTYIPNPINLADFPFKERERIAPKLLWVRSLARVYNPMMALETLKIVSQRYPEATLYMVGRDKNKLLPKLKKYVNQHQLKVTFTGRLQRKEWAQLAQNCDIFLNTAKVDHAPYSILEAVSLGLFILSNNVGGIPHIFKHEEHALLITPGDTKAMAAAVFKLIENEDIRHNLAANREALLDQYQWRTIRNNWRTVFENDHVFVEY